MTGDSLCPKGHLTVLTRDDTPEVCRLLDLRPLDNIMIASRVRLHGVERTWLGNDLIGYWEDGRLVSFLSDGYSLHPINASQAALDAFAARLDQRRCSSIVGVRDEAIGLWQRLCQHSYPLWASPREIRDHQMVMALSTAPRVAPHPGVTIATTRQLDSYHQAAVAMYTEEVGVAPLDAQGSYRSHVTQLLMKGQTFCLLDRKRVVFKADMVAEAGQVCQIGGVWLAPQWRGRGLSESLMAAVVAYCQQRYQTVTLYVNWYNAPAVKCYQAIGFTQVSECATILY